MSGQPSNPRGQEEESSDEVIMLRGAAEQNRDAYIRQLEAENRAYKDVGNRPAPVEVIKKCSFKTFLSCGPTKYEGSENPVVTMNWIREMEQVFKSCECEPELQVRYATRMLKGSALWWWDTVISSTDPAILDLLSWVEFS